MRVGLYDHPLFREHDSGEGHPERPARLDALRHGLKEAGLEDRMRAMEPRPASREELLRVHGPGHLDRVEATRGLTVRFDPDTLAGPRSAEAAALAAGAVVDAVDRVLDGDLDRALCLVRPPGHHAEAERAMGFCLLNNVAVGAAHALQRGLSRVAVVDFDVHHGNGTQDAFYANPRVLYVSSHAYPYYPGTGGLDETGRGPGQGFTVNLPMPPGLGDADYARVYREIVAPIGRAFDPELVLVSAGFDAHANDPLADMHLSDRGYRELAEVCLALAAGAARGRAIFVLEGGYDLRGLASSVAEVGRALLGEEVEPLPWPARGVLDPLVDAYRRQLQPFWPALSR
jgi:acetoin utilization deacetylase AcuC-like enzyme